MLKSRQNLRAEVRGYYFRGYGTTGPSLRQKLATWIYHFGMHCVVIYRLGQMARELREQGKLWGIFCSLLFRVLDFLVKAGYQVDISAADIDRGLYIGHIGTLYIGPCKIGKNFCVTHNVTIGMGHGMSLEEVPVIGDNVWVGTGSVISGAIKIGNNVTISSGSILSRDIPDGCLVGGNPARVLLREYDNSKIVIQCPSE